MTKTMAMKNKTAFSGILLIDKPEGITSHDVVFKVRRLYNTREVGHTGTLDPMATGLLVVLVGRAVKASDMIVSDAKRYRAGLTLGITTDTEDTTGTVLTTSDAIPSPDEVRTVAESFVGDILQVPPMYSALKVGGQKLCDLARKGREVERQPRPITIHQLELLDMGENTLRLRVRCSKGTYIRTLCKDIGEALGCGGCMAELRRVTAGEYTIDEAVPLLQLLEEQEPEKYLRGVDTMFRNHPSVTLTANQEKRCRCGNSFSVKLEDGTYRAYSQSGEFLMLAKVENGVMSTVKSFFEV